MSLLKDSVYDCEPSLVETLATRFGVNPLLSNFFSLPKIFWSNPALTNTASCELVNNLCLLT